MPIITPAGTEALVNLSTGDLYFDADGAGGAAAVRFGNVDAGTPIFNYDFFVI